MFTRCPNCNATFEVTEKQLTVHEGLVRCGVCKHVFNGKWFLLDSGVGEEDERSPRLDPIGEKAGGAPREEVSDEGETVPPPIPEGLLEEVGVRHEPSLAPLEEEPAPEESAETVENEAWTEGRGGAGVFDEPAGDLEENLPGDRPARGLDGELEETEPEAAGLDEELGDLGERNGDLDEGLVEEELAGGRDESAAPSFFGGRSADADDLDALLERERVEREAADLELEEPSLEARSEPGLESGGGGAGGLPPAGNEPIAVRSVDTYLRKRSNPLATLAWTVAALFFLFTLVLQVRTFYIDDLAANESLRPYVEGFCRLADCELPPRRDPARFAITHTRISLHPDEPGALRISVNLINEASFSQPYPDLQLTLTDRVGRIVGRRTYRPEEYLAQERQNLLPPGTLGKVRLDLAHPHEQAVGFEVNVVKAG